MLYDPKWQAPAETKEAEPWRELIIDAAKIIIRDGWIQMEPWNDSGVCILGALNRAGFRKNYSTAACIEACDRVAELTGGATATWNDAPGRTKEQVVALLNHAAALR